MEDLKIRKDIKVINDIEKTLSTFGKTCRVITCIHCIGDRCSNEICDICERLFIQEG